MKNYEKVLMISALEQAKLSQDPSTKVGAVLIGPHVKGLLQGFNRFVGDIEPSTASREDRYQHVVHAELGVLLKGGLNSVSGTLYCSEEPCCDCTKAAIAAGVDRIVFLKTTDERRERWNCEAGKALAAQASVIYEECPRSVVEGDQ